MHHNELVYNRSKLSLSVSHKQVVTGYPWRVLDILASSSVLVADHKADLIEDFPNLDIPVYRSTRELLSLTKQLLNDEKESQAPIELSPDFTDSNVLADLLADDNASKEQVVEANEIDDIKELDSLEFDELLANIEEESSSSDTEDYNLTDEIDIDDELDIGDELIVEDVDDLEGENQEVEDFVSVDSLLSDSFEGISTEEPYNKTNIDVGLDEFPEFIGDMGQDDVDDDNGIAAKLDLAKVYIEIGDSENAEVILMDVAKAGDAQQQLDAQQLLENLK